MSTRTIQKHGRVQAFNISPKGSYEGLLLEEQNGDVVQINFGHEMSAVLSETAAAGKIIDLEVEPEPPHEKSSHPVFRLISVGGLDANSFSGKVARLNYALHGEVNGGILDSGDFLHLKPHGAASLGIKVGMHVKGAGTAKPMVGGHRVVEAEEVNGISLKKAKPKPKPKKKAAHR